MKYYLIYILTTVIHLSFPEVHAQGSNRFLGMPIIEYFGTEDYNGGIQNYAITQDHRGIIYVANNLGLLEYDGSNWRSYGVDKGTKVRSLFADASGKIYVGAQNEFGYFFPRANGEYAYHSLNSLIPVENRNFDDVWDIYPVEDGFIFTNVKELFRYANDSIRIIPLPKWNDFTFQFKGKLYNQVWDEGLMYYDDGGWQLHSQGRFFADKGVSAIVSYSNEYDMISTYETGIYLINRHQVIPWAESFVDVFREHKINTVVRLKNGSYAVGTNTDGLYILDENGDLTYHFTKDKGLKNRTILAVFEDSNGNIWLGLNNGIAKIEWNSPFSFINEELNLPGTGYVAYGSSAFLYFGTNNGLFYAPNNKFPLSGDMDRVEGIDGQVYNIQRINGDVLVSCHFGAYQLDGNRAIEISNKIGWWTFIETDLDNLIIAGGYDGLYLLEKSGSLWRIAKKYPDFTESSRVMEFDENGILWMTHGYKGVYSFAFSDDYGEIVETKYYDTSKGFPSNLLINVFRLNGENVFAAESGIFTFDPNRDYFIPHQVFDKIIGRQTRIQSAIEDSFGNIYFIGTDLSGVLKKSAWDKYDIESTLFNMIHPYLNDDLEKISILDHENIIFSAKDGFIHYNNSGNIYTSAEFRVLFRSIQLSKSDSTLFGGGFVENGRVTNSQPQDIIPQLPHQNNSISFSYSAIDFNQAPTRYRYKLDGFENEWSNWSEKTDKEYTNLYEGNYSFQVEAKNIFDVVSPMESFDFVILPPWYRTRYAFIFYFFISLGSIFTILYYNRRKLDKEKRHLIIKQEKELVQRDNQLREVSRKSREEIERLKNEKLKSEIRHKKRELATSTMHLIDKNGFISSIKSHIGDMLKNDNQREIRHELKRIVKEIDKNIHEDDDWGQFEVHFDEVHEGFIKKLRNDYPGITPQEIKLSAYLRMNMSTKEIANLLRISVRGVEIARYRLRKKLRLGKEENLVDFMMSFGTDDTVTESASA